MSKERIGYRRLYQALGCFPKETDSFVWTYALRENLNAEIHIEPSRPNDQVHLADKLYVYPLEPVFDGQYSIIPLELQQLTGSDQAASIPLVTELAVWTTIDVPQELSTSLAGGDPAAVDELSREARKYESELAEALDLVAGTLALRFHRQFIARQMNEGVIVRLKDNKFNYSFSSGHKEVLDPVWLTKDVRERLAEDLSKIGPKANTSWKQHASILRWLLRAWNEQDPVTRFVSLFIPMEIMLEGRKVDREERNKPTSRAIRKLIDKHAPRDKQSEYVNFFTGLLQRYAERPSLEVRFEEYAKEAQLEDWERDVIAFSKYNKIRNDIVHRGATDIQFSQMTADTSLPSLENLSEKYLSHALFGDSILYLSRVRRLAGTQAVMFDIEAKIDSEDYP